MEAITEVHPVSKSAKPKRLTLGDLVGREVYSRVLEVDGFRRALPNVMYGVDPESETWALPLGYIDHPNIEQRYNEDTILSVCVRVEPVSADTVKVTGLYVMEWRFQDEPKPGLWFGLAMDQGEDHYINDSDDVDEYKLYTSDAAKKTRDSVRTWHVGLDPTPESVFPNL